MSKCVRCKRNKAIKKHTICFPCKDQEYKSYVGDLKPLRTVKDPCFFCKKPLDDKNIINVKIRSRLYKKMHKSCNSKRLKQINQRKWNVGNPTSGGTGSKK